MKRHIVPMLCCAMSMFGCSADTEETGILSQACLCEPGETKVIAAYSKDALETPEGLAIEPFGRFAYVSLSLTGVVEKVDLRTGARTVHAALPLGAPLTPCYGFVGLMGEIDLDYLGNAYVGVASCDLDVRGIWKIAPDGSFRKIARLPASAFANGIVVRRGYVYVADSLFNPTIEGRIWRAPVNGDGTLEADIWTTSPLLSFVPLEVGAPGTNGLQLGPDDELWFSNPSQDLVGAIPFNGPGPLATAGTARLIHTGPELGVYLGLDDFAVDRHGTIYGTTDPFQTVLKITLDGEVEEFLTAADGLDGPTAADIHGNRLYVTNASFPFFPGSGNGPSIMSTVLCDRFGG